MLPAAPRLQGDGQNAFDGSDRAIQGELTYKAEVFKRRAVQSFRSRDHSQRDRQVETGPFFFDVGRGKIDRRTSSWPIISAVCNGCGDPIAAFPHSGVWEPNDNDV